MKRKLSMTLAIILVVTSFAGCEETKELNSIDQTTNKASSITENYEIFEEEPQEVAEEELHELVQEESQEVVEEELQEIVQEEPQEVVEEELQEIVQEEPQEVAEGEPQELAEEKLQEVVQEEPQEIVQEESLEVYDEILQELVEEEHEEVIEKEPVMSTTNVNSIVTTKNIQYTFHETEFELLKKVPSYMADYFPSDSEGNLNDSFNAVITEISFKNMSNESNTFMLNSTSLRPAEDGVATAYVNDMRYFSLMNPNSKLIMQYTLKPNEEITCEVAFCVSDFFYLNFDSMVIVVNPDGTNPINENARVVPATIS